MRTQSDATICKHLDLRLPASRTVKINSVVYAVSSEYGAWQPEPTETPARQVLLPSASLGQRRTRGTKSLTDLPKVRRGRARVTWSHAPAAVHLTSLARSAYPGFVRTQGVFAGRALGQARLTASPQGRRGLSLCPMAHIGRGRLREEERRVRSHPTWEPQCPGGIDWPAWLSNRPLSLDPTPVGHPGWVMWELSRTEVSQVPELGS